MSRSPITVPGGMGGVIAPAASVIATGWLYICGTTALAECRIATAMPILAEVPVHEALTEVSLEATNPLAKDIPGLAWLVAATPVNPPPTVVASSTAWKNAAAVASSVSEKAVRVVMSDVPPEALLTDLLAIAPAPFVPEVFTSENSTIDHSAPV